MAVRIVENFWYTYQNNMDIIIRCFRYHFHRHPDPDGKDQSFNTLIVKLHELKVFERFDLNKLVEAAEKVGTINKSELSSITEEELKKAGIDVDKKWEQFLFNWIKKILCNEYDKRGSYYKHFCRAESLEEYGTANELMNSWITDSEEAEAYEKKFETYKKDDRRGRKIPPSFTNRYVAGEEGFDNPFEATAADDLRNAMSKRLSDIEMKILGLLEQGYTERDIVTEIGYSQQYVNKKIHAIRAAATAVTFTR
jgi:hypothetical protein